MPSWNIAVRIPACKRSTFSSASTTGPVRAISNTFLCFKSVRSFSMSHMTRGSASIHAPSSCASSGHICSRNLPSLDQFSGAGKGAGWQSRPGKPWMASRVLRNKIRPVPWRSKSSWMARKRCSGASSMRCPSKPSNAAKCPSSSGISDISTSAIFAVCWYWVSSSKKRSSELKRCGSSKRKRAKWLSTPSCSGVAVNNKTPSVFSANSSIKS